MDEYSQIPIQHFGVMLGGGLQKVAKLAFSPSIASFPTILGAGLLDAAEVWEYLECPFKTEKSLLNITVLLGILQVLMIIKNKVITKFPLQEGIFSLVLSSVGILLVFRLSVK